MKVLKFFLIFLIVFSVSCCSAWAWSHSDDIVRISHAYDGDTVRLTDGRRIRLAGIDTPERNPEQYWAKKSESYLKALLRNANMRVRLATVSVDRHQRVVAELFTLDGVSLNEKMLRSGMAYFYYHKELPESLSLRLLKAQQYAVKNRAGMWRQMLVSRIARQPFTGNKNSRRFFSQGCKEGEFISRFNRVRFRSFEEALLNGYAPSRTCSIWPLQHDMR